MFRYIISILNQKEKNELIKISVMTLISPVFDLFSFSVILFIMKTVLSILEPNEFLFSSLNFSKKKILLIIIKKILYKL